MPTLLILLLSTAPLLAWEDIATYRVFPENVDRLFIQENGEYLCFSRDPQGRITRCQLWLILHRVSETQVAAIPAKKFDPSATGGVDSLGDFPPPDFDDQPILLNLLDFSHLQLIRVHVPCPRYQKV